MSSTAPATALQPLGDGRFAAALSPDWAQGRASFGGVVAAQAWAAVEAAAAAEGSAPRPLRSFVMDFVRPTAPGPSTVVVEPLGAGRTMAHRAARVEQAGQVTAAFLFAEGAGRQSPLSVRPPGPPPLPDDLLEFGYIEGLSPTFTQHFQYRTAPGCGPFAGSPEARMSGALRFTDGAPIDVGRLMCLLDAFPAPVLSMVEQPTPISTVTWMVNLLCAAPAGGWPGAGWWRFESTGSSVAEGYVDCSARIWSPEGALIATSHQLVAEFAR